MLENNKTYTVVIAYDGTDFAGWQVQKNKKSIANCIENRFFDVFKHKITLIGSSRTDAGAHAYGQVATFTTCLPLEAHKIKRILSRSLPPSITIRSLEECSPTFHPRYDVEKKTYWYHLFFEQPMPWLQRYGYYVNQPCDSASLQQALQIFVGTHDFRSFCSGYDSRSTVRTIDTITVERNEQWHAQRITITGNGFLRYMVRRIIGASLYVAQKKLDPSWLKKILEQKNPRQTLPTAPAHGLLLYEIYFKKSAINSKPCAFAISNAV